MMPKPPKNPFPTKFAGQQPSGQAQVAMNAIAFDELIRAHGIRMIHSRPLQCPKRSDIYATDHDPSCTSCHNGYIYYGEREFTGAFMGNNLNRSFGMTGTWDLDQAQIILPAEYTNGDELDVQYFDQISIPDFTVRYPQLVEHSQTGIDRLHFDPKSIDKVIDADGREYIPGVDVIINEDNRLEWISSNRPIYNIELSRGSIYTVNYYCSPVFTVVSLPHQLRATQTIAPDGSSVQERFPQLAICRKDFLPQNKGDHTGPSDTPEPTDGSF